MKVTHRYQADEERTILTAMIVSDRILGRFYSHLKTEKRPFSSKWCNLVGQWCFDHFAKYQKAPKQTIKSLFNEFAQSSQDTETVDLMEDFLAGLSNDYKSLGAELNEDYTIDLAARFFNKVKIAKLCEALTADLEVKKTADAEKRITAFHPFKLATTSIIDVLTDDDALRDAVITREDDTLIQYPNALGQFFNTQLCRDAFIVFLAPEKRGKSFFLIDMAWRSSIRNKRRTLFYSVGDMSQRQMMRRFLTRAANRPLQGLDFNGKPTVIHRPIQLTRGQDKKVLVSTEEMTFREAVTFSEAKVAMGKMRAQTAHNDSLLKLRCTPNGTTTIADIDADCEELARKGWIPQVIVIDYMDILAAEPGSAGEEFRNRTNITWQTARQLSQKRHCLVVSATQANAASYGKTLLGMDNFSEDKRKWAHVTGGAGINQTEEEKDLGLFRLNWIVLREGASTHRQTVTVAGHLGLANPAMISI